MTTTRHDVSAVGHYLRVLRRGAWVVVVMVALGTSLSLLLALGQDRLYRASAEVFLTNQNLAATLANVPLPYVDPQREAETQATLARSPAVARQALKMVSAPERTVDQLLASSSVTPAPNSDLLTFEVTDRVPAAATLLATTYARAYTSYRREVDTGVLVRARRELEGRLSDLRNEGQQRSPLYISLAERVQQLRTLEVLQGSNALLMRPARGAAQIQPRPVQAAVLGGVLGLVLGLGLAFLLDAVNTRVRSAAEVQERLGLPLLGRLPAPGRRKRDKRTLTMLSAPNAPKAEAFRILATNIDFENLDRDARTIMVTSATRGEGKSTTVANLAVAYARTGRRVAVVDLDLRRPSLHRFFDGDERPGLTHVALGRATLDEALVPVWVLDDQLSPASFSGNGAQRTSEGTLLVLGAGVLPPNPAEFIRSDALGQVLGALEQRADLVLIDAPPLLQLSDAMILSARVDALFVVTRLPLLRRPVLNELRRVLDGAPVAKLGFVVTGEAASEGYGYGYGYGYHQAPAGTRERERVS